MGEAGEERSSAQGDGASARRKYTREELLALRDNPKCRSLPQGLDSDDLSDLQESCFFDKAPTPDGPPIYLGPQRGSGGLRAPFGTVARRPAVLSPGPIHSRLIDEDERSYQHTGSGQLTSAFGPASPTKPQAIQRGASARYEDPARMDRWDSRKLGTGGGAGSSVDDSGWQQQKARGGGDWRGGGGVAGGGSASATGGMPRGIAEVARSNSGWTGRDSQPDLARQGSSVPKDPGRWVRDEDDWRARKQSGALPEPRYDWSDNRAPGAAAAAPGAATARGPPPGFHDHRDRQPEWMDEDPAQRSRMTAADMEAERLRMQEQWKKQGGTAAGAAQSSMNDLMTDDDIMSMMAEENERQGQDGPKGKPNGAAPAAAAAPKAGQHVDVAALLGSRPQPQQAGAAGSPGGISCPTAATGTDRTAAESMRSRFANFFKLEESPAPGAAGDGAAAGAMPQQLSFEELSQDTAAAAGAGRVGGGVPMPTQHMATPAEIEHRLPPQGLPPGVQVAQSRDAGQALLAMLKQQQAAQAAAVAGGGGPPHHALPANAVKASDVSVLEEADKVARLMALQGLGDDAGMTSPAKSPARAPPPGSIQLPPGVGMPPPGHMPPGQQMPLPGMQGFPPGQLPPGMLHLQHMPGHMPRPGGPFTPGQMPPGMHPPPPGMQPPPPGMQYRPPAGMQYRPPGLGLPPQPGLQHPGIHPSQPQHQQQQQNALLAQLLAAQANRGPPAPQQQQQQQLPQVQPGQQFNLAALLGAAGNSNLQLQHMQQQQQQGLNPGQLQGMRPHGGMMSPGMPGPGPGLAPGINPALLQQLQMQQQGLQRQVLQQPHMPLAPMQHHLPPQQQLSSQQLMAALGLVQQVGMPPQGMR